MKVKELIELLGKTNPEREVVISRDSEGNGFSPFSGLSEELYVPYSTWSGEIYIEELTEEMRKHGYSEEDTYGGDDGVKALVFWPIN